MLPNGMRVSLLRRAIRHQLQVEAHQGKGLSASNWVLVFLILLSIALYTAETEKEVEFVKADAYWWLNIGILGVFAAEFILRLYAAGVEKRFCGFRGLWTYVRSDWRMVTVDFLAFAPELIVLAVGGIPPSWLRALRVFRLLKIARYVPALTLVIDALKSCYQELLVALSLSAMLWYLAALALYLVESDAQPEEFGSITRSMWWSVVTLTTVGYGDVYPISVGGKIAAGLVAVIGVGTVALPSGIIAGAFLEKFRERRETSSSSIDPSLTEDQHRR